MIILSDYDITYETNHSDTCNFAQNEEDEEGCRKLFNAPSTLTTLIPPEVNKSFFIMFRQVDLTKSER